MGSALPLRLRFWLHAMDAAHWLHCVTRRRTQRLYLWTVGKASDAEWSRYD